MHMAIPRIGKLYVSSSAAVILAPICRHDGIQNFLDLYYSIILYHHNYLL